jgi:hypothetical protein
MRMTKGLTLRRTARRINRLNGASALIVSGDATASPPVPGALLILQLRSIQPVWDIAELYSALYQYPVETGCPGGFLE